MLYADDVHMQAVRLYFMHVYMQVTIDKAVRWQAHSVLACMLRESCSLLCILFCCVAAATWQASCWVHCKMLNWKAVRHSFGVASFPFEGMHYQH